MQNKYLSLIFRQFSRNRFYTVINVLSIAVAITIALLVYSFVVKEVKTDGFHRNGGSIYRVLSKDKASEPWGADHCGTLGAEIGRQVSGVEAFVRLWEVPLKVKVVDGEADEVAEKCLYADTSFFKVFTFPLVWGGLDADPPYQWAVISKRAGRKYFGDANPVGRQLAVHDDWWLPKPQIFQVIAVMEDIPAWSTIRADIVLDYRYMEQYTDWNNNYQTVTYVKLNPQTDISGVEENIRRAYSHASRKFKGMVKLQPLAGVYYDEERVETDALTLPRGSLLFTRLIAGITLLILFLSSCSYIMIKVVQSQHNVKLFALQRCFGAGSRTVWKYFLTETAFYFLLAGLLGVLFTRMLFPYFQEVVSPGFYYPFPLSTLTVTVFLLLLGIFILFITAVLSMYFLKRLTVGIKEAIQNRNRAFDLRKILAFVSIAVFSLLFIDASIVNKQMNYLQAKDLGYDAENTMTLGGCSVDLKAMLEECPDIVSVSMGSTSLPLNGPSFFKLSCRFEESGEMSERSELICGDTRLVDTYRLRLVEGENFNPATEPTDEGIVPLLVNQQFVRQAGLKQAVGTFFKGQLFNEPATTFQIIGVVSDFHFKPLYESISPLVICYSKGSSSGGYLNNDQTTIRYVSGKQGEVIKYLQDHQIEGFYAYDYNRLYGKEKSFIRLINITACIALLIGGFGIFAFAVFYAASRKKEVALRKISGGTEWEIQRLLHREFVKITLVACIVTMPVAYYLIHSWLQKFAYRGTVDGYVFVGALLLCLVLVVLVITWQIRHITRINPAECLKEE